MPSPMMLHSHSGPPSTVHPDNVRCRIAEESSSFQSVPYHQTIAMRVAFLFLLLLSQTPAFSVTSRKNGRSKPLRGDRVRRYSKKDDHYLPSDESNDIQQQNNRRRDVLRVAALLLVGVPLPCSAGEVGAQITKAVTTSDLGVSVRTSVVKGAQVFDQLDGQWERLSDRFGLGSERSKQIGSRPKPKVIPDPLPLDVATAKTLLEITDQVFCSLTGVRPTILQERVDRLANLIKVSFERSGVATNPDNPLVFDSGPQFNFVVYSHFKAYSEIIVEQKIPFGPFRSQFEIQVGQQLVTLLQPRYNPKSSSSKPTAEDEKRESLMYALKLIDDLSTTLRDKGLVAAMERSPIADEKIEDWLDGISDLEFTIALDLDTTLDAQILLQEQGFRLYPNFARYAVSYLLQQQVDADQKVGVLDYYFDTDYSSDPDKFEVKEVLLSVTIENL